MLLVAGIVTLVFKRAGQPLVLGYLVAGFLIGPHFNFFPDVTDTVSIQTWSEIGIIVLMFSLGLEFNLHKLASVGGTGIITAFTEALIMPLIGFMIGQLLNWSTMDSIFLGGMLCMASTTIVIKAFGDLKLRGKRFTELVFGTLVVEDIIGIFVMVILSTISVSQGVSGGDLAITILKMLFYLALWLILGIFLIPTFFKKAAELMNSETMMVVSLGLCFGMTLLAELLGFSSALGAFLAGSLLAGTIHAEKIEQLNRPIKDLFGTVFFVSVGMMVDPSLIVQYALPILIITLVVLVLKPAVASIGMLLSGQPLNIALSSGFSLSQVGEFSFIIATLGLSLGVTSGFLYPTIVCVSVLTIFTTPYMMKAADPFYRFLQRILPDKLLTFLERNTSEEQAEVEKNDYWAIFIKKYFSRLFIYTVIMLAIILAGVNFLWPFMLRYLNGVFASVLAVVIIIGMMAPFMQQCLNQRNNSIMPLWFLSRSNHFPLMALLVLRLLLMVFLLVMPIKLLFTISLWLVILLALMLVAVIVSSDRFIAPYLKLEARFLSNFNERNLEERKKSDPGHQWLDSQIYVTSFVCDEKSRFNGRALRDLDIASRFNIIVIKIVRGGKHINIPAAREKILAGDMIFLIGQPRKFDVLSHVADIRLDCLPGGGYATLHNFINEQDDLSEEDQLLCYAVTVKKESKLGGISIKESRIKESWGCLLLGLERDLLPILSPDLNMHIEINDIVWVLGPQQMAGKLVKAAVI